MCCSFLLGLPGAWRTAGARRCFPWLERGRKRENGLGSRQEPSRHRGNPWLWQSGSATKGAARAERSLADTGLRDGRGRRSPSRQQFNSGETIGYCLAHNYLLVKLGSIVSLPLSLIPFHVFAAFLSIHPSAALPKCEAQESSGYSFGHVREACTLEYGPWRLWYGWLFHLGESPAFRQISLFPGPISFFFLLDWSGPQDGTEYPR
ncbi:hypothetical protein GQ53DRAFT_76934 [Thozetella sp. PMI_491]|nr:hypothetical protein GQ53DRAFT_76934 [Thozetella sp. PMI_491]